MQDDGQKSAIVQEEPPKRRGYKKIAIITTILIAFVCLALAALFITQTLSQLHAKSTFLDSMKKTLQLQAFNYTVDYTKPKSETNMYPENLKVDGAYKKGAGLSAAATSIIRTNGIKDLKKSRWVVDTSSNVYGNLSNFDLDVIPGGPFADIPTKSQIKDTSNKLKDTWTVYTTTGLDQTYTLYGVNACLLTTFYKVQTEPKEFQEFLTQISDSLDVRKTDPVSGADAYRVTVKPDDHEAVAKKYQKSDLYKKLTACDKTSFAAKEAEIRETIRNLTISVAIDSGGKFISSLSVHSKNSFDLNMTISPTDEVNITIPKNAKKPESAPTQPTVPDMSKKPESAPTQPTVPDMSKKPPHISDADYKELQGYYQDYVKNGKSKDTKMQVIEDWRPYAEVTE